MACMKILTALALLLLATPAAYAQATGCDTPESKQLDFWVGDWELATVGQNAPGKSRNRITKILDGCAILEEFDGAQGSKLVGRSVSTYDRASAKWKQTWVDNTASYLDFEGGLVEGDMSFWREAMQKDGRKQRQRMVWKDVKADSLKWLWQKSDDDGRTWSTQWEIDYRRIK
jgi:hypothetical protein